MDVDVIEVAMLDDEYASQFEKPWLVQWEDGTIKQYDTEDEACAIQRQHRINVGLDPMTGEL